MTFEEAKKELGDWIKPDGGLYSTGAYLSWSPGEYEMATLDGDFDADTLMAIAVYIKEYPR